jgi:hypothetical protein
LRARTTSPLSGTYSSKEGLFCKAKNTTKCVIISPHPQHVVELCEFIVDDRKEGAKKKRQK